MKRYSLRPFFRDYYCFIQMLKSERRIERERERERGRAWEREKGEWNLCQYFVACTFVSKS